MKNTLNLLEIKYRQHKFNLKMYYIPFIFNLILRKNKVLFKFDFFGIMKNQDQEKNIVVNRKARFEYTILQTLEAGIVLQGTEVKSLRLGKANLSDAYANIKNNEVWIINLHISEYTQGNINNHDPLRIRKLLLNKSEIRKLLGKIKEKGLTLVPLRMYFKNGKVKAEIALAKGKKVYDKRESIAKKDFKRDQERKVKY